MTTITIQDSSGTYVLQLSDQVVSAIDAARQAQMVGGPGGTLVPQYPEWKSFLAARAVQLVITPAAQIAAANLLNATIFPSMALTVPPITGTHGQAITNVTLAPSGGVGAPYTITASNVPTGLTVSSGGIISGTVTNAGTYAFTVTVTDAVGNSVTVPATATIS